MRIIEGPVRPPGRATLATAPHVMAKPTGAVCNLDCGYCFYLVKEELYPDSPFRMDAEVMRAYIRRTVQAARGPVVDLVWQGGEPTMMGLDFYRAAVEYAASIAPRGTRIAWSIQTNGVLVDDEWGEFLAEHDVLVGLSVDGPQHVHDRWRVNRSGRGSWAQVMRAAGVLHRHGVRFNTLTTVHPANQDDGRGTYRFLRDEVGSLYHQYIPIVVADSRHPGRVRRDLSVDPAAWGSFLLGAFDEWLRCDVGSVFVMNFEWALASWCGDLPAACMFRPTCGQAVVVEHNGDVYSCDHYVDPEHRLGSIVDRPLPLLLDQPRQRAFGEAKAELPQRCLECPVRFACHGECPKNRLGHPDQPGLNYLCEGYLRFFTAIDAPMRFLAEQVITGRDPRSVMAWPGGLS